jgi:hypothetical protein
MTDNTLRHIPAGIFFLLDDAPIHFSCHGHAFLDGEGPDHWIGRGGPIPWPSHSPDLTPSDSFFLGFVKDIMLLRKSAKCE